MLSDCKTLMLIMLCPIFFSQLKRTVCCFFGKQYNRFVWTQLAQLTLFTTTALFPHLSSIENFLIVSERQMTPNFYILNDDEQ